MAAVFLHQARQALLQAFVRAVQAGRHGPVRAAQHVGDLLIRQSLGIAEDDDHPEVGGEAVDAARTCPPRLGAQQVRSGESPGSRRVAGSRSASGAIRQERRR